MKIYARAVKSLLLALIIIILALFLTPRFKKVVARQPTHQGSTSEIAIDRREVVIPLKNHFREEVLRRRGPVTVVFFADWCPSCMSMKPIVAEAANELKGIPFISINVDEFEDVANTYGIQGIPTFIFFKDGKQIGNATGYMEKDQFIATIKKIFGDA